MNFFDIVFTVIFVIFIGLGFKRGILGEILSAFGFVTGYLAAEQYYRQFLHYTANYIGDPTYAKIITYIAIFFFGAVLGIALSSLARILFGSSDPYFASRVLGGGLGLAKGILIALVIVFIVQNWLKASFGDDLDRSFYIPQLIEIKRFVMGLMPA